LEQQKGSRNSLRGEIKKREKKGKGRRRRRREKSNNTYIGKVEVRERR
jgi:hypothetical protein